MKRLLWISLAVIVVVCVALVLPRALAQGPARSSQAPAAATTAPQRSWYSVNIVTVRPESMNEFVEFQKSQTIPMLQRGGVKRRDVWQGGAPFGVLTTGSPPDATTTKGMPIT